MHLGIRVALTCLLNGRKDQIRQAIYNGFAMMRQKWSDEERNEPLIADTRNFYKVEKWTKPQRM